LGAPSERTPRGRGERRDRGGERNADASRERSGDATRDSGLTGEATPNAGQADRGGRNGREDRAPRNERGEGRRERRYEGPAQISELPTPDQQPVLDRNAVNEASTQEAQGTELAPRREGDERRGRSRDRYGRDRRDRGPREDGDVNESASMPVSTAERDDAQEAPVPVRTPQVVTAPAAPIVVEAKATSTRALPKVQPFVLPLDELAQVAEGSGLHWVNSDAERVAQVRAAIAAEPRPLHVPRERPPAIVIDEGPLVLVETRRDLAGMVLPFEKAAQDSGARP
jgi:ribonuclease E